jgi:membrane protein YqaA with SNARE-associated domain
MLLLLIAFLWGASEATFFVIVPDVWISYIAWRRGTRPAMGAACFAAAGAIVGGVVLWHFTLADPASIASFLVALPGIDAAMRADVSATMAEGWIGALVAGGFGGIPYKLFVAEAATLAVDPALFFTVSVFARLVRFLAVAWLAACIGARVTPRWRLPAWAAFWLVLYVGYFALVGF